MNQMWSQLEHNNMEVVPVTDYGWKIADGKLAIDWPIENTRAIQRRVEMLTNGCKCGTSCKTLRCNCRKKGYKCSEGCSCINCSNVNGAEVQSDDSDIEEEELEIEAYNE